MADSTLLNMASASGVYNGSQASVDSEPVSTLLIDGLSITKTADREAWTTGTLLYTITVTNRAEHPFEDVVIIDTIAPAIVSLVEGSVTLNGAVTDAYTYDENTDTLQISIATIGVGESAVVTFQVQKARG